MWSGMHVRKGTSMKKLFSVLLAVTVILFGVTSFHNKNTIIIYSSLEQFRGEELQKQLDEQFPDLEVYVMYVPTAKAAAKISIEGENSDADIVVALESAYLEKVKDNLEKVDDLSDLDYLSDMRISDGKYVVWERQAGSIILNKKIMDKNNIPIPQTYKDLLNPIYKNMIVMPDPKSSGTGFFFYKNLVNEMGDKAALEYFDQLAKNVKAFTESGSGPVKMLIQGEAAIGLGLTFQAVNEINNGNDFEILEPEYGSPYSLTGASVVKGKKNKDVEKVFRFIVNDFLVYDKENFSPEQILEEQKNNISSYPQNIHYANMKGIEDINEKERLLSLWRY